MSVAVDERPARPFTGNGGFPARRAVIRWAWRLLRREWRQQLLILSLITVAVAATFVGSTVATNAQEPAGAGFGTALDMATFKDASPKVIAEIAALAHRFGAVDVVENRDPGRAWLGRHVQPARAEPERRVRPADALPGKRELPPAEPTRSP